MNLTAIPSPDSEAYLQFFQNGDEYGKKLGYEITAADPGRSEYSMQVDESFLNPLGIVHGGALFSLMDSSAGAAITAWAKSTGKEISFLATGTAEIRYRKTVQGSRIRTLTTVEMQRRSIVRSISMCYNEQNELLAELKSTWFVQFAG